MNVAERFAEALNEKFPAVNAWDKRYGVIEGRKFDKIVATDKDGGSGSVSAFVERETGKLVKAATWNAPAFYNVKGVKTLASNYNLSTEEGFAEAVEAADRWGSYLYAGRR